MSRQVDRLERRLIDRASLKEAMTRFEGFLRHQRRMDWRRQVKAERKRSIQAAIRYAIYESGGESRYTQLRKATGLHDKQLSKILHEMMDKNVITKRVDITKKPPATYYMLTKEGYEDKRLQRELLTDEEIPSLIIDCLRMSVNMDFHAWHREQDWYEVHHQYKEGFDDPLGVAREMVDSIFSAALFIVKIIAENSLKRIVSKEVLGFQRKDGGIEVPLEFYSIIKPDLEETSEGKPLKWLCGYTPDLTEYTDVEDILIPRFIRGLTRAICYYLMGVRHIEYRGPEDKHEEWVYWPQGDYGLTDEQMKKIVEERFKAFSQALAEKMKVGEDAIMQVLSDFWHGKKGDAIKTPRIRGSGLFESILWPGYPIYRYTPTAKKG